MDTEDVLDTEDVWETEFNSGADFFDRPRDVKIGFESIVHIRIRQGKRVGKYIMTIEGLKSDLDQKKILRFFKKYLNTNGAVMTNKETQEEYIQLQGDNRKMVAQCLRDWNICDADDEIKIHG